jgi:hypothetical protein
MVTVTGPKRIVKIVLEDGGEIVPVGKVEHASIDREKIIIFVPIKPSDWARFWEEKEDEF